MRIKSLAQGENILMLGFEPSTFCIQNRHSNHWTNCSPHNPVPHKKLLFKLSKYGITDNINKWIQSFLVLRKQQVIVEGESSKPCSVDSGVPQGSVLGPLLFLCHINDLPQRVTSTVRLFADDCLLYRPIHSPRDQLLLQQDLAALETWAEDWGMRFNVTKCYLMSIHRSKHPYSSHY